MMSRIGRGAGRWRAGAAIGAVVMGVCALAIADGLDDGLAPGMVRKKVGSSYVVVPKGTLVTRDGDVRRLEDPGEYAGRNILMIEKRLDALEARIARIRAEIAALKASAGAEAMTKG